MKNVDDLIEGAAELAARGLSKGEIADELNVSRETASWLVERSGASPSTEAIEGPPDIHVDWSTIGRDSHRLSLVADAMADLLEHQEADVDLTIGIEKAGAPIATAIALALETDLGTYAPRKHQWEEGDLRDDWGTFSRNFAQIRDRDCYVVDDIVTSGTTLSETVRAIRDRGGNPVACCVLVDKRGVDEIEGIPVHSLVQVLSVGEEE